MSFGVFSSMFFLVFFLIFGMILFTIIRGIGQWSKNNHSPRLTVAARVVAKRQDVRRSSGRNHTTGMSSTSYHNSYYVTFQVESGDRMELQMTGPEYGMLIEGDQGKLTFQGTRYLGFERM